jgi:hypothetical protein
MVVKFNWNENRNLIENEVGLKYENGKWIVYVTDERASIVTGSVTEFCLEEEALENFIKRIRTEKILFEK